MANWAQNKSIAYKEYVPVNPVDLMTQVGVHKEQDLQLGIEKVNSYFSQIAGLDVARDVDKQHIQQRLGDLKQGITKNLSGDFSDQRIINQIGGAASQIYKDPQIQNGVLSTAALRSGQTEMETARKEGKNGPSNDAFFLRKANEYLSSTGETDSFNYRYEKYTPVEKNIQDIVTKMLPSGYTTDEAFVTDPKTGKKVLADYVLRDGFKGVKPEQIRAALRQQLSPQDWRQLELDGMYNYSNVPPQDFAASVQKRYTDVADQYKAKIALIDGASTTSAPERAQLDETKKQLLRELDNLETEYNGVTSTFAFGDADSAKAKLYTLDKINNTAVALSHGEITSTIVGDTPQQIAMKREEQNMKNLHWAQEFNQRNLFHTDEMTEKRLTREQKDKELAPTSGGVLIPKSKDQLPEIQTSKLIEDANVEKSKLETLKGNYITQQQQIYGLGTFTEKNFDDLAQRALDYPASLTAEQRDFFNSYNARLAPITARIAKVNEIITNTDKQFPSISSFIPQDAKTVTLTEYKNGNTYNTTFSPQDFVNYNTIKSKYATFKGGGGTGGGGGTTVIDWELAKKELGENSKNYRLLQIEQKNSAGGAKLSGAEENIKTYITNYNNAVNTPYNSVLQAKNKQIVNQIQSSFFIKQNSETGLNLVTPAQKASANTDLANLAQYATATGGKIGNATAEQLLAASRENDKTITFTTAEGNEFQQPVNIMHVTTKDGNFDVPLSQEQMQGMYGNRFRAPEVDRNFQFISDRLQQAGNGTTQLGGMPFLQPTNFPGIKLFGTTGEVSRVGNSDRYTLRLTVNNPITHQKVPLTYPAGGATASKADILVIMNNLTDEHIYRDISKDGTMPSKEQMKSLIIASQKPVF